MNRFHLLALSSVVAIASSGCIITTTTPSNGTLEVDWTINGRAVSADCSATASREININVNGSSYRSSCSNFATTVTLPPGTYSAGVSLVDAAGNARTTTATITFSVSSNSTTVQAVDFPSTAFF